MKIYTACVYLFFLSGHLFAQNIYFGDLHVHSNLSDGSKTLAEIYDYARDSSNLDFICITDHDSYLLGSAKWDSSIIYANQMNTDNEFVAFIGYEYTPCVLPKGHKIVIYPGQEGTLYSSSSVNQMNINDSVLSAGGIINVAHPNFLPFAAPISSNTEKQESNIEVTSIYRYEYYNNPGAPTYQLEGASVQDWISNKKILGFVGVSDTHTGEPGLNGLTGVIADSLNRNCIFNALKNKHTFATNGKKIRAALNCGNYIMGDILFNDVCDRYFEYKIEGTSNLIKVEIIKNNIVIDSLFPDSTGYEGSFLDSDTSDYSFYYIRAQQDDGGILWTSPIYFLDKNFYDSISLPKLSILIYPNPTEQFVIINYTLPQDGEVNIKLFDQIGQNIKVIKNSFQKADSYNIFIDMQYLAKGFYFLSWEFNNQKYIYKVFYL